MYRYCILMIKIASLEKPLQVMIYCNFIRVELSMSIELHVHVLATTKQITCLL